MYLGIDFGTSGCRAVVIDQQRAILAEASQSLPAPQHINARIQQQASIWLDGLNSLFQQLAQKLDLSRIRRLAIDGTSASVLLCDEQGKPLTAALMYNDSSSREALETIKQRCPDTQHITMSSSSALAKAIQLSQSPPPGRVKILHQADYLSNYLCGQWGYSDYHNALKLGYDTQRLQWPEWVRQILPADSLPIVLSPGQVIGRVTADFALRHGLSDDCQVCAGSTDANAAFLATLSTEPGDAVTSLGTTLVLKILNDQPVQQLDSGIYSHKLGDYWLTGGASNAGAGILRQFFSDRQIAQYSTQMDLQHPTGLGYYPLPAKGERFPCNDPDKKPVLSPRPASDIIFLQAILEGLSQIEKEGYQKLESLGAAKPKQIQTCGGGAKNPQWTAMRSQQLGIPVVPARHTEACFGSALLALQGLKPYLRH